MNDDNSPDHVISLLDTVGPHLTDLARVKDVTAAAVPLGSSVLISFLGVQTISFAFATEMILSLRNHRLAVKNTKFSFTDLTLAHSNVLEKVQEVLDRR